MRQRDIFWFWLPLFASWFLMTAEGPIIAAAINRLPDEIIMLAAMGIVSSLSITIESPIINLLATSTALVRDHASYRLVRRFTIHWCLALTLIAILVAYTRLFDLIVPGLLDVPPEIAAWVRPGMRIMVFWSAAIGWRRFLQGILIRFNRTRAIALGTAVRLLASGGVAIVLAVLSQLPGVIIGALGLMSGVIAEALYATWAVRPVLRGELAAGTPPAGGAALTYRGLSAFHIPLAATSVLVLMLQPMVTSSLARLDQPTLTLAAWPIVFQIALMARAGAMALPEVVIALHHDAGTFAPLRRFSLLLTAALTAVMALFVFTPAGRFYIFGVQDMTDAAGALALASLPLFLLLPGLTTLVSWLRGLLIQGRHTRFVNIGMAVNLSLTAAVLIAGVVRRWPGLPTAALAMTLALLGEVLYLTWRTRATLPVELPLFGAPPAEQLPF